MFSVCCWFGLLRLKAFRLKIQTLDRTRHDLVHNLILHSMVVFIHLWSIRIRDKGMELVFGLVHEIISATSVGHFSFIARHERNAAIGLEI